MSAAPVIHEIEGTRLFGLFPDLVCEACGTKLAEAQNQTWVKAGCGYFCAGCVALGRHLACVGR